MSQRIVFGVKKKLFYLLCSVEETKKQIIICYDICYLFVICDNVKHEKITEQNADYYDGLATYAQCAPPFGQ